MNPFKLLLLPAVNVGALHFVISASTVAIYNKQDKVCVLLGYLQMAILLGQLSSDLYAEIFKGHKFCRFCGD